MMRNAEIVLIGCGRDKFLRRSLQQGAVRKIAFSTDDLPPELHNRQRGGMWVDSMRAIGSSFEVEIVEHEKLQARVEVLPVGPVYLGSAAATPIRIFRPNDLIARDGDDRVMLLINVSDARMNVGQLGREITLERGDVTVLVMGSSSEQVCRDTGRTLVAMLPRNLIAGGARTVEDLVARPLNGNPEARRLLTGHVDLLLNGDGLADQRIAALASDYLAGLFGMLVGDSRDGRREAALRALPAARLAAARAIMRRRFREPGLSAADVGGDLNLSPRYIQHLFQLDGATFSGELMAMRLAAARAELIRASAENASVTDIAFHCGFGDLSTFYRAFRARYGETPNAVRGDAIRSRT